MSYHFYTVTIDGRDYAATCPHYKWAKVCEYFGVTRNCVKRGAVSSLPTFPDVEGIQF